MDIKMPEMPQMPTFGETDPAADKKTQARANELDLWKRAIHQNDKKARGQLLISLRPAIMHNVLKYKNSNIPLAALEGRAYEIVNKALPKYDPTKAQLNTFVFNQLQQLKRTVSDFADIGYIPEQRALKISTYKKAIATLSDDLNREPTTSELADHLSWPMKEIERLRAELKGNLLEDTNIAAAFSERNRDLDKIESVYLELDPQEQLVMEYRTGLHGKEQLTINDIATRLGMTVDQVRKISEKITGKILEFGV